MCKECAKTRGDEGRRREERGRGAQWEAGAAGKQGGQAGVNSNTLWAHSYHSLLSFCSSQPPLATGFLIKITPLRAHELEDRPLIEA